MADRISTAEKILKQSLGLRKRESALIVTDRELFTLASSFFFAAQRITGKARILTIDIPKTHGAEPHPDVAKMMRNHDVCLLITTMSLTHTEAREAASRNGARIASMPGLRASMFSTALKEPSSAMGKRNSLLMRKLKRKRNILVTTEAGTRLSFSAAGRTWVGDDGDYAKKGVCGNLPAGEIFIAPLEGTANGEYVIDASLATSGVVRGKIVVRVVKGKAVAISGGKDAVAFAKMLISDRHRNVAEFGIGTNSKARITGEVLEDEKVLGTCHIALGNNAHFGGTVDVPFHVDGVIKHPTIVADGAIVMKKGKIVA